jgi:DNA repair exonuclease SbcCD nuclease subunit
MVRILHTGDIHLGKPFRRLGAQAEAATKRVEEAFSRVCTLAIEQKVDVLVIAGDLFDSNKVSARLVAFAKAELSRVGSAGIHVGAIAGTHDKLEDEKGAVLLKEKFSELPLFHFLQGASYQCDIPDLSLTLCGHSNVYNKSTESPLRDILPQNPQKYSVGIVHASVAIEGKFAPDDYPVTVEEVERSPFSYIAFGHWHRMQEVVKRKAWYAGSPEVLSLQEEGAGNVLLVEIDDNGVHIEPQKVGVISFDTCDIELSRIVDIPAIEQSVLRGASETCIRTVTLRGVVSPDTFYDLTELRDSLAPHFFALKILDKTTVSLDDETLQKFPEELVIGRFVRMLKAEIDAEADEAKKKRLEKALQIGIALLLGREVL